jgi:hypothetical protein
MRTWLTFMLTVSIHYAGDEHKFVKGVANGRRGLAECRQGADRGHVDWSACVRLDRSARCVSAMASRSR